MKFLLTVHQFFPEFSAGTEVLAHSVAKELLVRGHDVVVFTGFPSTQVLGDDERLDEYDFDGIHVYCFSHAYVPMAGQSSMIEVGYDNHLARRFFEQILKKFKPDIIHFFHLNRLGTGLIEASVQASIPAFYTPTDFWMICPTAQLVLGNGQLCTGPTQFAGNCIAHFAPSAGTLQTGVVGKLAKKLPESVHEVISRLTSSNMLPAYPRRHEVKAMAQRLPTNIARLNQLKCIVSPNRFMTELLIKNGVRPERIVNCAYGISASAGSTAFKRLRGAEPLRIGFIGTLAPHKGCHVLIEAFKRLPEKRAVLKIYGGQKDFPEYAERLTRSAKGDEAITFCGTFPNAQIADIFQDLDVLVVPSLWVENNPLVLYSAQACLMPVIGSHYPGIAEVIAHDVNGLLFEAGNASALGRQLQRLIDEKELLPRLSSQARPPKPIKQYVNELLAIWNTLPAE